MVLVRDVPLSSSKNALQALTLLAQPKMSESPYHVAI